MKHETQDILKQYAKAVDEQFQTSIATEHSYRPALQKLLSELLKDCIVINEPSRIHCGAPDYIIIHALTETQRLMGDNIEQTI